MIALPKVIYLHGLGSSPHSPKARLITERLTSLGYQTTAPDLSVPSLERLSVGLAIDRVQAAVKSVAHGGGVFVIGSSFGGFLGLQALSGLPSTLQDQVMGVVLLAPALYPWHPSSGLITPAVAEQWRQEGALPIESSAHGGAVRVHLQFMEDLRSYNSEQVAVEAPIKIIHGRGDKTVPISQSEQFCAGRPGVTLVSLDDGHELMADPVVLMRHIEVFFAERSPKRLYQ
jgi:pimeloyl-ACP methyl ester carboxylesterase